MARPQKATSTPSVSVKFSIGSDVYTGKGKTLLDALKQIKPRKYMGICKVEATIGNKVSRLPLRLVPTRMKRLFEKPIELELLAKRLQTLL